MAKKKKTKKEIEERTRRIVVIAIILAILALFFVTWLQTSGLVARFYQPSVPLEKVPREKVECYVVCPSECSNCLTEAEAAERPGAVKCVLNKCGPDKYCYT